MVRGTLKCEIPIDTVSGRFVRTYLVYYAEQESDRKPIGNRLRRLPIAHALILTFALREMTAKSAENRQLQNDAISSVFNSQSTFCTKVVGMFELRTKIKKKFQNQKFIAAKKLKTVFFFEKFRNFLENPPKIFFPDL